MSFQALSDKHRKLVRSLHLRKHRDEELLFVAEGIKVVQELLNSSYGIEFLCVAEPRSSNFPELLRRAQRASIPTYACSEKVFSSISDTPSPQGVLAVARMPEDITILQNSESLQSSESRKSALNLGPRVVALDGVQDPGNTGTIVRTAHFFGYSAVLLGSQSTDRFNGKFIRSAMGSSFHIPCIACDLPAALGSIRSVHTVIGADAHAATPLQQCAVPENLCIVIGSEGAGISTEVNALLDHRFVISGRGGAESLNASVAAGICLQYFS
ncbi:MAG: hypothetical protein RL156_892 [Bacteroidota bacterium]|jgi:TrmH family RNA methyltransferase